MAHVKADLAAATTGDEPVARYLRKSIDPPPLAEGEKRRTARSARHGLKRAQRLLTESISSRLCFLATEELVSVDVGQSEIAHVSGIRRCGSPWACPTCAPVVRQERASDIDRGLGAHFAMGGGAEFVTLTTRHHQGDELAPRLDVVSRALMRCLTGASWKRRAARLGYIGAIRAVEITYGARWLGSGSTVNGWHPHCHALLLFDRPLTAEERADLHQWLYGRWGGICEGHGFGTISAENGVDVREVVETGDLADYLAKVEGGWGAGLELARADAKRGRKGKTPFELLIRLVEDGEARLATLWREYEAATRGKRAIVWSPGLRKRLLGDEEERSDEEAAAAEGEGEAWFRVLVGARGWNREALAGRAGALLSEIEARAAEAIAGGAAGSGRLLEVRMEALGEGRLMAWRVVSGRGGVNEDEQQAGA